MEFRFDYNNTIPSTLVKSWHFCHMELVEISNMEIDFNKNNDGLVPAIIQEATTKNVLMLGFMNEEAYQKTIETKKVTFFSRTKQRLWTKGEESGNFLNLVDIKNDCDKDTLLITVNPVGPTCHKGDDTCWAQKNTQTFGISNRIRKYHTKSKGKSR